MVAPLELPVALPAYQRGDFIGDQLQVIEKLGEGGFGIVYLARSLASDEILAVKTLRAELLRDAKTRAMFEKEARIWIDLGAHPNLVRASWISEIGGRLYIGMEYVKAGAGRPNDLEGHLAKGPIETGQALLWAIQFCRGMEYAVSKGIRCHRDIKPANILIGADSVVKISDFGIAGLALVPEAPASTSAEGGVHAAADPSKTVAGTVFGTPSHMPPEQFVDAASCDERSDIYSFGVVLYQVASSGRLPFLPPPPPPAFAAQAGLYYWHAFRQMHESATEAPLTSPLAAIVTRAMKKKREERYPGFAALRADLEALYEKTKGEKAPVQQGGVETANSWNARGISLAALNRWAEAVGCYDKAIALEPLIAALHNNRGNALRQLGRAQEALAAFDQAIALDPLYAGVWENKALLYAQAQRNDEALTCVDRAIALDPTAAGKWVTRGAILGRLGRSAERLESYEKALQIDPRNGLAWFNKANVLSTSKHIEALECLNRSLSCDPSYAPAWDLKGTVLSELGLPEEAVSCHQEAIRLDPRDWQAHYNLGNAWVAIERLNEARESYEQATRLNPGFATAWYNLALTALRLGQPAQALALFDRYVSIAPAQDDLRRTAERLSAELRAGGVPNLGPLGKGKRIAAEQKATIDAGVLPQLKEPVPVRVDPRPAPSRAVVDSEPLPPPRPSTEAAVMAAANAFNAGRFAEALAQAEKTLKIAPRDPRALNTRANSLFKIGRKDEACAAMNVAVEAMPGDLTFWVNKAFIERGAGRLPEAHRSALDLIEIAEATNSKAAAVDHARRLIAEVQGKGIAPSPRSYLGWLGLGFAAMIAGRTDQALSLLDEAVTAAPQNVEILRWKGSALTQMKRADDALAIYDRAIALDPGSVEAHHDRGVALAMLREFGAAVEAFDRALALDPDHAASLSDKGKYAGEMGRHEEALKALRRAAALEPDHPAPWLNKALVEDLLNLDADALLSYERFLKLAKPEMRLQIEASKRKVEQLRARVAAAPLAIPEATVPQVVATASFDECLKRSEMVRNQGHYDKALVWADQAIVGEPRKHHGWLARAEALFGLKRFAEAVASAKKATELQPGFPPSWIRLAASYDALDASELALPVWDKAVELAGQNVLTWNGKGVCLARLGRLEESLAVHDKSLDIDPRFSLGKFHKGMREADLGRRDAAIKTLQQFLALAPPTLAGLVQEARRRIQALKA